MKGNVNAACFIRDTIGESPGDQIRREELKVTRSRASLEREKFEYEKAGAEHEKASPADAIQAATRPTWSGKGWNPFQDADGGYTEGA